MYEFIGDQYTDDVAEWVGRRVDQGDVSFDDAWRLAQSKFDSLDLATTSQPLRGAALCRAVLDRSVSYTSL